MSEEYIKRDDAIEAFRPQFYGKDGEIEFTRYEREVIVEALNNIPSTDVVSTDFHDKTVEAITDKYIKEFQRMAKEFDEVTERKKGEWIEKNSHTNLCNICGFEETTWWSSDYNFCPNCGADMRGDEHE